MLLTTEEGCLQRTAGLDLYIGLMHATERSLDYMRLQPPELPQTFTGAAYNETVCRSAGFGPNVFRLEDDTVLKVHRSQKMFDCELRVFSMEMQSAPVMKIMDFDHTDKWLHLDTYCPFTLADDITFSPRLFQHLCRSAAAILRALWGRGLAYMDPKPANVLLTTDNDDAKIFWNDFGSTQDLGLQMFKFQGSREYSSVRINELDTLQAKQQKLSVFYGKEDDAQAVFFTLLSFAWKERKLPWHMRAESWAAGIHQAELIHSRKKQWVEKPTLDEKHVQQSALSLLREIHEMLFRSQFDGESICQKLDRVHVQGEGTSGESAEPSRSSAATPPHAAQMNYE